MRPIFWSLSRRSTRPMSQRISSLIEMSPHLSLCIMPCQIFTSGYVTRGMLHLGSWITVSTPGSTRVCNQLICTRNTVPGGIYSLYYFGLLPFALNGLFRLSIFGEVADLPSVEPEIEFIPLPSVIPTTPIIPTSSATKEIVRSHAEDVLNGVTM